MFSGNCSPYACMHVLCNYMYQLNWKSWMFIHCKLVEPFKLSIPKVLVFITTCLHSFLREGLVDCLFALSWMIRMALVIHSYISDFKKTRVSIFFNCNEQRIWTSLLQIDHTVFHHMFSLFTPFYYLNDLLALPKLHYLIIVLSSIFLAIWLKVFMIEPWLESL